MEFWQNFDDASGKNSPDNHASCDDHEQKASENSEHAAPGESKKSGSQSSEADLCAAELNLWKDQCKRISAEFENYKRRTQKEQERWADFAKESILVELLSFIDTFEMALTHQQGTDHAGIAMVHQALLKLLAKHEVKLIENSTHFDPLVHEAVMQVPSDKHASGDIVEVLSKGFTMKDKVLRPARVSVAI